MKTWAEMTYDEQRAVLLLPPRPLTPPQARTVLEAVLARVWELLGYTFEEATQEAYVLAAGRW